jgi:hypothetical protein
MSASTQSQKKTRGNRSTAPRRPRHYSASVVSNVDSVMPAHWLIDDVVPYRLRYELAVLLSRNSLSPSCTLLADARICAFLCEYARKSKRAEFATLWFLNRFIERENSSQSPLSGLLLDRSSATTTTTTTTTTSAATTATTHNNAKNFNKKPDTANKNSASTSSSSSSSTVDQLIENFKKQFVSEVNCRAALVFGRTIPVSINAASASTSNSSTAGGSSTATSSSSSSSTLARSSSALSTGVVASSPTLPVFIPDDATELDDEIGGEYVMIAMITITNTEIVADNAQPRRLNRVLRHFASKADRFARVLFRNCNEGLSVYFRFVQSGYVSHRNMR